MRVLVFFLAALCAFCPAQSQNQPESGTLRIAAAADLSFVLKDVAGRFEKSTGSRVALLFGSSGNFYSEISNGAPFDVFLSADTSYPQKLIDADLARSESLSVYARG